MYHPVSERAADTEVHVESELAVAEHGARSNKNLSLAATGAEGAARALLCGQDDFGHLPLAHHLLLVPHRPPPLIVLVLSWLARGWDFPAHSSFSRIQGCLTHKNGASPLGPL